jgi:alkanesulfonate monooxygenase SsuD/methylene tetrahydromethanopterin reductase-like flavin-dependent oxidoreductase (luciferase family)
MAMHLCGVTKNLKIGCGFNIVPMWHPLRLAEDYAMADILTGGRVIFGVGRGYHTREVETFGNPLIDQNADREMFEEALRCCSRPSREALFAQGQVLHDPAGGAVSRLHVEGDHPGAGAGVAVGRMLAADPIGLRARLRLHAKYGISGVIGGGSAEGGAVERHMLGFQAAYARRGIKLELGERLALGYQFHIAPSREDPRGGAALRREHENVRRIAPRAGLDRRADRGDARPRLAGTVKLPTIEDAVKAGGFLGGRPEETSSRR